MTPRIPIQLFRELMQLLPQLQASTPFSTRLLLLLLPSSQGDAFFYSQIEVLEYKRSLEASISSEQKKGSEFQGAAGRCLRWTTDKGIEPQLRENTHCLPASCRRLCRAWLAGEISLD
ncbi:hypothetical protein MRX96_054250 [Rhipicephalus microplus]